MTAEWGEECATCGEKPRREDDLFCSDACAQADWMNVGRGPDPTTARDCFGD